MSGVCHKIAISKNVKTTIVEITNCKNCNSAEFVACTIGIMEKGSSLHLLERKKQIKIINIMENKKEMYLSPEIEEVEMENESVLCTSAAIDQLEYDGVNVDWFEE